MWKTRITAGYDLKLPFIGAGMAFISGPELVWAVSEAGGMGMLGATGMPPELLRESLKTIRQHTSKPYGIDIIPRFATLEHIQVAIEEHVPVVVFFWDEVPEDWMRALKAAGIPVWIQVGSLDEAKKAISDGADALIVQGGESGGHNRASAALFSLLPVIVDHSSVPVIAAGGIADGRGVIAALALGAEAVWVGTRLLASHEANAHPEYKQRVLDAGVGDTERHLVFGPDFPDASVRGLRNRIVREYAQHQPSAYKTIAPDTLPVIGEADLFGMKVPMTRFMGFPPTANASGDLEEMSLLAGESVGLIHNLKPAAQIVQDMMDQAHALIGTRLSSIS